METVMFYILGAITVASAFCVVLIRRPIHNVLFMILTMIGLAGLFILLHAEFIAMVQLIVYAGAVMVLFLFVVMLLNLDELRLAGDPGGGRWWLGVLIMQIVLAMLIPVLAYFAKSAPAGAAKITTPSNTTVVARELFTTYLLPFEIASVLLLAAIIGTVILVRKKG